MRKETFILEVRDIQNQSWQGTLKWIGGHRQEAFRSVLEMLHLIDSVVGDKEETDPDDPDMRQ